MKSERGAGGGGAQAMIGLCTIAHRYQQTAAAPVERWVICQHFLLRKHKDSRSICQLV